METKNKVVLQLKGDILVNSDFAFKITKLLEEELEKEEVRLDNEQMNLNFGYDMKNIVLKYEE